MLQINLEAPFLPHPICEALNDLGFHPEDLPAVAADQVKVPTVDPQQLIPTLAVTGINGSDQMEILQQF